MARQRECSQEIELIIEGNVILDAAFYGGNGNLKGIVALCKGQKMSDVKQRHSGITFGGKRTSFPGSSPNCLCKFQNN